MTLAFAGKSGRRKKFLILAAFLAMVFGTIGGVAFQQQSAANADQPQVTGAVNTTDSTGTTPNGNKYDQKCDVYLHAANAGGGLSPDGLWYVRVTDPNGSTVLTPAPGYFTAHVTDGEFDAWGGADGQANAVTNGAIPLCAPATYGDTPNPGGEYKAWASTSTGFANDVSKTDNFKVFGTTQRELTVCKVVVDNNDPVMDGGEFKFDLRYGTTTEPFAITATENDALSYCITVLVPTDGSGSIAEWGTPPATWNGNATGYPKVQVDSGPISSNGTANFTADTEKVTFYNRTVPSDRVINICKVVDDNGIPPANEGATFHFDVRVHGSQPFTQVAIAAAEGDTIAHCTTVSLTEWKIPLDANIEVVEWGDPAGWISAAGYPRSNVGTNETAVLGTEGTSVVFHNKRATRTIEVCKVVDNNGDTTSDGGTFTFDVRYFGDPAPLDKQYEMTLTASEADGTVCGPATVPAGVNVEVAEWDAAPTGGNWNGVADGYPWNTMSVIRPNGTAALGPGDAGVTFHNETVTRTGTLTVSKAVVGLQTIVEDGTFNLLVNGVIKATDVSDGGTTGPLNLVAGTYTVSETQGSLSGEPLSSYTTTIECTDSGGAVANPVVLIGGDDVTCLITNTRNAVASAPVIIVRKWSDPAGNMTGTGGLVGGWPITITGTSGPATGFTATELTGTTGVNLGVAPFDGIPEGTYTVSEPATTAGWVVVGSMLDGAAADADNIRDGAQSVTAHNGSSPTVDFYNEPRVAISVHKDEVNGSVTTNGAGWHVTLTGCGITPQTETTDSNGNASFSDLPVCATYQVSEDLTSKLPLTYVAVSGHPATVTMSALTAGQTYTVNFQNTLFTPFFPNIVETPTTTPVTPTATTKPEEPKTATPTATVTEITLGEKTPGPTPLAPVTGTGPGTLGGGTSLLLMAGAFFALSGGFGVVALKTRRARR